jgi:hypothetical protein
MKRRNFIKTLLGLPLLISSKEGLAQPNSNHDIRDVLIQTSPIAGFQYYQGELFWEELTVGDKLQLNREPDNPYDEKAVAIYREGVKLGYLPRVENIVVARLMDKGQYINALIGNKQKSADPWERMTVAVWLQI